VFRSWCVSFLFFNAGVLKEGRAVETAVTTEIHHSQHARVSPDRYFQHRGAISNQQPLTLLALGRVFEKKKKKKKNL